MNLHFSFKTAKSPEIEKEINQHVSKLSRRLQAFRPDLVHLHGTLDSGPPQTFNVSLNLRLPSGQLSAHDSGLSAAAAMKSAFCELLTQVQRHKEFLRSEHKWRRQSRAVRYAQVKAGGEVAREETTLSKKSNGNAHSEKEPVALNEESANGHASEQEIDEATFQNPHTVQSDVNGYINANLPTLERFVNRELRYRESSGQLTVNLVSPINRKMVA